MELNIWVSYAQFWYSKLRHQREPRTTWANIMRHESQIGFDHISGCIFVYIFEYYNLIGALFYSEGLMYLFLISRSLNLLILKCFNKVEYRLYIMGIPSHLIIISFPLNQTLSLTRHLSKTNTSPVSFGCPHLSEDWLLLNSRYVYPTSGRHGSRVT